MQRIIRSDYAAPMGDIRNLGPGDEVLIYPGADQRADWPRLQDAVNVADNRGAEIRRIK
jgi:hypothetical protein